MSDREARRPTIYDVAEAAGVSKSLVSLVLQGSPRVSPARRAAVQAAIERLQYRPSQAAAVLAGHRTRTIGMLLDDYRNLWFVDFLDGIQQDLAPSHYRVAVENFSVNAHLDPNPLDGFLSLRVDGIVIAMEPTQAMTVDIGIPVVVAGARDVVVPGADVVANDDRLGGRLAVQHLVELGHAQIGHLTGAGGSARLRTEGYLEAVRAAGATPSVARADGTAELDGYRAAELLLDRHPETSAIFAANDTMAFGAAAALAQRGLRIPQDVSVIGYDNSPLASSQLLQFTTIDGQNHRVGTEAARALLSRIEDPARPTRTTLVDPTLVLRGSTAPAGARR